MLFNLVMGLRQMGRYDEANRVATHVLEAWPHREGADDMHLFLAVEDALAGRLSSADKRLQRAPVREGVFHDHVRSPQAPRAARGRVQAHLRAGPRAAFL